MTWRAQVPSARKRTRAQRGPSPSPLLAVDSPAPPVPERVPSWDPVPPPKGGRVPASGPRPLWPGIRAAGAGAPGRGPFKARAAVARARSLGGRLPGPAEHLAGRLWPATALGPGRSARRPRPGRAQPPRPRDPAGARGAGDAARRARGRGAGARCPAGPAGLARPGPRRAAPAGACGGAAPPGPWAARVGTRAAAPAHPDASVRPIRASQLSGGLPGLSSDGRVLRASGKAFLLDPGLQSGASSG